MVMKLYLDTLLQKSRMSLIEPDTESPVQTKYSIRNTFPIEGVPPMDLQTFLVNPRIHRSLLFQCVRNAYKDECINSYVHFDTRRYLSKRDIEST